MGTRLIRSDRIEIAIDALVLTERYVDVQTSQRIDPIIPAAVDCRVNQRKVVSQRIRVPIRSQRMFPNLS